MPYCVQCGVKLRESEPACPLCGTQVMIPGYAANPEEDPFPKEKQNPPPPKVNSSLVFLISVLVAVSAIVSITVDLAVSRGMTWSLIVLISLALFWMLSAFPMILLKRRPFYALSIMAIALAAFLLALDFFLGWHAWSIVAATAVIISMSILQIPFTIRVGRGIPAALADGFLIAVSLFLIERFYAEGRWFVPLGLPISLLSTVYLAVILFAGSYLRRNPYIIIPIIMIATGVYNVGIEVIINNYTRVIGTGISWSIFVLLGSAFPAAFLFYLGHNQKLRHSIKKRLHI